MSEPVKPPVKSASAPCFKLMRSPARVISVNQQQQESRKVRSSASPLIIIKSTPRAMLLPVELAASASGGAILAPIPSCLDCKRNPVQVAGCYCMDCATSFRRCIHCNSHELFHHRLHRLQTKNTADYVCLSCAHYMYVQPPPSLGTEAVDPLKWF